MRARTNVEARRSTPIKTCIPWKPVSTKKLEPMIPAVLNQNPSENKWRHSSAWLAKKSDPSTIVSSRRDFPPRVCRISRDSLKCKVTLLLSSNPVAIKVLIRVAPPFNPSGNFQPTPAPDRRIMYPEISPANSIASEARNVSIPKRTTFGPGLGSASTVKAEELMEKLYRSTISKLSRAGKVVWRKTLEQSVIGGSSFLATHSSE